MKAKLIKLLLSIAYACVVHVISLHTSIKLRRHRNNIESLKSVIDDKNIDNKLTYDVNAWRQGYITCEKEICEIIGTAFPSDIEGTYFR